MENNESNTQGQNQNSQGQQNSNQGQSTGQSQAGGQAGNGQSGGLGGLQDMLGNLPGILQQASSGLTGKLGKLSTTQKLLGLAAITLGANYLAKRTKANNKNKGR